MTQRLALALFLSFLVLILWPAFFPPPERPQPAGAAGPAGPTAPPGAETDGEPELPDDLAQAEPWSETIFLGEPGERGHYRATFDSRGASLTELRLDGFYVAPRLTELARADPENWVPLVEEVEGHRGPVGSLQVGTTSSSALLAPTGLGRVHWEHEVLEEDGVPVGVRFRHDPGTGVVFTKTVLATTGRYELAFEFAVHNVAFEGTDDLRPGQDVRFVATPAMGVPRSSTDNFYTEPKAAACWERRGEPRIERHAREYSKARVESFPPTSGVLWGGVDNKYFAVLLRPLEATQRALREARWRTVYDAAWARENPGEADRPFRHVVSDLDLVFPLPEPGGQRALEFALFAGPKQRAVLREHAESFEEIAIEDLGFFKSIGNLLLAILGGFHGLVGNWGVAIILLTLLVRTVLFPFNRRSQTAMARHATKMKRVQPKLTAVKEKYAKDPKKLREEQARIMQEEGAFPPLGGCLPIFVQIPVFFGLFSALRASFELRQAPFLWVIDLAQPDRFMPLDIALPFGFRIDYLNILPPAMVVIWILQQKVMPKPTDEQALRMHKMMMWMPILFGFFLYEYPAGLSLYMITTSFFGIMEYTVIRRIWPIDDTEQPKKKSGFMARMAELSEQAKKMEQMKRAEAQKRKRQQSRREPARTKQRKASRGKR